MLNENAFVPLCLYGKFSDSWKMKYCNIFKRSFTNVGIGYTFNNLKNNDLYKDIKTGEVLFKNDDHDPIKMKSADASSKDGLYVMIEANAEEVDRFEKTKYQLSYGNFEIKPVEVRVTLHNPSEPANALIRSKTFDIPLGLFVIYYHI